MKVRMSQNYDSGLWYESEHEEPIELPDAIVKEWRELTARMEELTAYFDERVPPLQAEADAKLPPREPIPLGNRWAKLMLENFIKDTRLVKFNPTDYGTTIIGEDCIVGPEDRIIYGDEKK